MRGWLFKAAEYTVPIGTRCLSTTGAEETHLALVLPLKLVMMMLPLLLLLLLPCKLQPQPAIRFPLSYRLPRHSVYIGM
jgi:hypothetical protein